MAYAITKAGVRWFLDSYPMPVPLNLMALITFEERTSCHVAVDGNDIFTANYHTGTVSHLRMEDGTLGKPVSSISIPEAVCLVSQ